MAEKKIGFDTGFFIKILQENNTAIQIWKDIQSDKAKGFVSCLSLFEIERLMLKGAIDKETTTVMLDDIQDSCEILWISNPEILSTSAKISHGNGIPAVDALILTSLLSAKIETVYTTDTHISRYKKKELLVITL